MVFLYIIMTRYGLMYASPSILIELDQTQVGTLNRDRTLPFRSLFLSLAYFAPDELVPK
jgi:hypothetical protein